MVLFFKKKRENEKNRERKWEKMLEWQREGHKSPLCTTVLNYQIKKKIRIRNYHFPVTNVVSNWNK